MHGFPSGDRRVSGSPSTITCTAPASWRRGHGSLCGSGSPQAAVSSQSVIPPGQRLWTSTTLRRSSGGPRRAARWDDVRVGGPDVRREVEVELLRLDHAACSCSPMVTVAAAISSAHCASDTSSDAVRSQAEAPPRFARQRPAFSGRTGPHEHVDEFRSSPPIDDGDRSALNRGRQAERGAGAEDIEHARSERHARAGPCLPGDLDRQEDRTATSDARRGGIGSAPTRWQEHLLAFDPVLGLTGDGVAVAAHLQTSLARQMITPMPVPGAEHVDHPAPPVVRAVPVGSTTRDLGVGVLGQERLCWPSIYGHGHSPSS